MTTNFKVTQSGGYTVDLDDILMRREYLSDGQMWGWGYNIKGQLGTNNLSSYSSPTSILGNSWKQVATGYIITGIIDNSGVLWTCGYNNLGQLGDNSTITKSSPVTISGGGTTWKQMDCGDNNMAAVKTDGTLWTWGSNQYGELGTGDTTSRSSPGTTAGGGTNWKQVACAVATTVAIKTDGTLWTFGFNNKGQLGDGTTTSRLSPVTTAGGGTNWKQVACGYFSTAAIKTDGTLWTWGGAYNGQLGDGTTTSRSSPGTTAGGGTNWKQVSIAAHHTVAIKTDGTLWTWGRNSHGQLGTGNTTSRSSPGTTAGGGTTWKQVSCSYLFTAAIKTDGTLWTCGYNYYGQLGDGTTTAKSSPITIAGGGTTWKQVDCGWYNTVALVDLTF